MSPHDIRSLSETLKSIRNLATVTFDTIEYVTMRAALYGFMLYGVYKMFVAH